MVKTTVLPLLIIAFAAVVAVTLTSSVQHVFAVQPGPAWSFAPGHQVPPGPPFRAGDGVSDFAAGHQIPPGPPERAGDGASDFAPGIVKQIPTGPGP